MAQDRSDQERFARDGLTDLRKTLRDRFAGDAVIQDSVTRSLDSIIDEWDSREPLHSDSFDLLVDAIRRPLDALLNLPVSDARASAAQLSRAWSEVRPKLRWG